MAGRETRGFGASALCEMVRGCLWRGLDARINYEAQGIGWAWGGLFGCFSWGLALRLDGIHSFVGKAPSTF